MKKLIFVISLVLVNFNIAYAADGKSVYESACMACHNNGLAGAPKIGDAAAWAPRISKGVDELYKNSIAGFKGDIGFMPAKGGRADLSDEDVKAAVDHIVASSK